METTVNGILRNRFDALQHDLVESTPTRVLRQVRRLLRSWGKYQLQQNNALGPLDEFLANRPGNAIAPNYADLWFLYKSARQRKPKVVLEFGSGCSTVILAAALWHNQRDSSQHSGILYSVDADQQWAKIAAQDIPTYLREFCDISYSPLLEVEYKGTPGFRHANVPKVVPNFLYLDGPDLTATRQVTVDVLDIEDRLPADFYMVVDGRIANVRFLQQHFTRTYRFTERSLYYNETFELIA